MTATTPGSYAPAGAPAPLGRMVGRQGLLETRLLLRNGEQLLLTIVIPVTLLVLLVAVPVVDTGTPRRVNFLAPGVLALAVLSTSFTGQAIATGFERRYGVLVRLAVSPLPRAALLTGKALAVLLVEIVQLLVLSAVALALGWRPDPAGLPAALLLVVLATAAFSGLALLMAGTLRAEATLAAANLVYVLLLVGGGIVVPLDRFPAGLQGLLGATPVGLLSEGLRQAFGGGTAPWAAAAGLTAWAVLLCAAAARWFRWE